MSLFSREIGNSPEEDAAWANFSRRSRFIPFPQTDLKVGKRRPALVLVSLPGVDLILCQITTRMRPDDSSIELDISDFEQGQLSHPSFIRQQRLLHG